MGLTKESRLSDKKSQELADNIHKVFGVKDADTFLISTQVENGDKFYPDRVGQLYPVVKLMDNTKAQNRYAQWMRSNGKEWLLQRKDDYPWGLVAMTALEMQDSYTAACWQNRAEPMRYSNHWNVVEEVILQNVKWQLTTKHQYSGIPCVGGDLS
jgi:hypothetical protein